LGLKSIRSIVAISHPLRVIDTYHSRLFLTRSDQTNPTQVKRDSKNTYINPEKKISIPREPWRTMLVRERERERELEEEGGA
jgi:hypothetical protein